MTATRVPARTESSLGRRGEARIESGRATDGIVDLERAISIGGQIGRPADETAPLRFALARALWSHVPRKRSFAQTMARAALADLPAGARLRAEVEAFVADPAGVPEAVPLIPAPISSGPVGEGRAGKRNQGYE